MDPHRPIYDSIDQLVRLLFISKLNEEVPYLNFGLYRDDELGTQKSLTPSRRHRMMKHLFVFRNMLLKIILAFGLGVVDFLDVTLNLANNTFKPYRKPNDTTPLYVNPKTNSHCVGFHQSG